MELNQRQTIFSLFAESFKLVNRSFGVVLVYGIFWLAGIAGNIAFAYFSVSPFISKPVLFVYNAFLTVLLFKLLASRTHNQPETIADICTSTLFPTIYMVLLYIFLWVIFFLVGLSGALGMGMLGGLLLKTFFKAGLIGLIGLLVAFFLGILVVCLRFVFAPMYISLRDKGPIDALVQSWRITSGNFFRVLCALIISALFPMLVVAGILYGLYMGIPLYFAESFNLAALTWPWIATFIVLAVFCVFVGVSMTAFMVLLFLNLEYTQGELAGQVLPDITLPDLSFEADTPSATLASAPAQAVPPAQTADNAPAQTATANAAPQPAPADSRQPIQQTVHVTKASVHTNVEDASPQQLKEVYQPKPEDIIEYTEEDRMPTILFDDEMARQLEAERTMWEEQKKQARVHHNEDDFPTIKMSK